MSARPLAAALAASVFAGAAAVSLASPAAAACEQPNVAAAAEAADVVFAGAVESSTQARKAGERVREVTVTTDRIYQGQVDRASTTVTMPATATPQQGEEWFFFVDGDGADYTAVDCSGSQQVTPSSLQRVEAVLGAGEVFVDPTPPRDPLAYERMDVTRLPSLSRILAPGASLALFGLLGLALTRRRD